MLRFACLLAFFSFLSTHQFAQKLIDPKTIEEKMTWFADAKLGIFIHTGIYSVKGINESWSFHNREIGHTDYMNQLSGFTLDKYQPEAWAQLIQQSGARYAVITTKHHDGVATYHTKMNKLSTLEATPARRDMVQPFFEALRKRNIKCGAYYSLIDWTHDDYPGFLRDSARYKVEADYARWQRFRTFFQGQIDEISKQLNPDLWWFDGDWEHSAERWESEKIRQKLLAANPQAIINGRLQGYGDYETPEQNFPVTRPEYRWWELCMTTNDSWGYQVHDTHWKTPYEVISIFTDVVGNGGNLLLDIGPKADGTIPPEQIHLLQELGAWNKRNGEAVFGTVGGMPQGHYYGASTYNKDSTELYLFVQANTAGQIMLKGLNNSIEQITALGAQQELPHRVVGKISWSKVPGLVYINLPKEALDPYVTVIRVKLKDKISLYRGRGGL